MTLLPTRLDMPEVAGLRNLGFTAGAAFSFSYPTVTLTSEDVTVGVTIVEATLIIRPGVGQPATLTKTITTASTADGQITDSGVTDGVGALHIDVTALESAGWTARQVFQIDVTDNLPRVTTLDSGYLVPVTGFESDFRTADRVVISPTELHLPLGGTGQISAVPVDDVGGPLPGHAIIYTSSDTAIITVASTGVVTAVGIGAASVFATSDAISASASISVAAEGAVSDTFTRPDDAASLGTADTGQVWTAHRGVWGVTTNQCGVTTPDGVDYDHASVEVAASNVSVSARIVQNIGGGVGVTCRLTDENVHIKLEWQTALTDGFVIYKRNGAIGTITIIGSGTTDLAVGDVLKLTANGSSLTGYVNDVPLVFATDAFNDTATRCGLSNVGASFAMFDEFLVTVL